MPYDILLDLPDSVKDALPKHAQEIYRAAYNSAWNEYKNPMNAATTPRAKKSRTASPGLL